MAREASYDIKLTAPWLTDFASARDHILPHERPLVAATITWGAETGNRLHVCHRNGAPSAAFLRLELRAWDDELLAHVADAMSRWGAMIIDPASATETLIARQISSMAMESPVARFAEDP
jgi:hypothetical protein